MFFSSCALIMSCVRFALSPVNAPSAGHTVSAEELESHLNTATGGEERES